MASQLEYLKKALVESEARSGPANPFVQGLKAQIAALEKPPAENPMDNQERFSLGMRSAELPSLNASQETEQNAQTAQDRRG